MANYVYGLVDPTNNKISYIGITSSTPYARFAQHLAGAGRSGGTRSAKWIGSLISSGHVPGVVVLQTTETPDEAAVAERWWIAQGQILGWPLHNTTHMQQGSVEHTERGEAVRADNEIDVMVGWLRDLFSDPKAVGPSGAIRVRTPWSDRADVPDDIKKRLLEMVRVSPRLFTAGDGGRWRIQRDVASNFDAAMVWLEMVKNND